MIKNILNFKGMTKILLNDHERGKNIKGVYMKAKN